MATTRPPLGLVLLGVFFALGAVVASATGVALLLPGDGLDPLWRLNPQAHEAFLVMGPWAIALMAAVAVACAGAAFGLWIRAWWGHRLTATAMVSAWTSRPK